MDTRHPCSCGFPEDHRRFLEAIAFTGDGDDLDVLQEPVEHSSSGGHIT